MSYDENIPTQYPAGYPANAPQYGGGQLMEQQQQYYQQYTAPVYQQQQPTTLQSWFNFQNSGYLKGFAVGAGVALVLANPTVQRAIVSGAVKLWTTVQGGVEEIKEHVKDITAEISTKE